MKRTVSLLALLAALCCLFTVSAAAADAPTSGTCGANLTWALDTTGTLTISGTGAMEEYRWNDDVPWYQSRSSIKAVVIGNGVTTIGDKAFYYCSSLTDITLPESVISIGKSAFQFCESLPSITIPESVTSVSDFAFACCSSLTSVTFVGSSQLTTIGDEAFYQCRSLTGITLPESVTLIGESAFYQCTALTSVTFAGDSQLTTIGSYAFYRCKNMASVTIPKSVTNIGEYAFYECASLTSVTFAGDSQLTTIGDEAFYQCSSLTGITIPESVTSIGIGAFEECRSLANVTIPDSVTTIGRDAFAHCGSLTSITLPEGLTAINAWVFASCSSLTSVTIPEGVTSIGDEAFYLCSSLTGVYISDLNAWCGINFGDKYANPLYSAKNLYLNGALVESLEIPGSVSVIPTGLFRNAKCLKRVAIPRSLLGVAANAFKNCTNITEVFYEGSESEWANLPISAGNDPLKNAQVYFNSTLENYYCRITVAVSDGGRVTVDHITAKVGDTVTVTAAPYPGYELAAICVDGADIEGDTFTVTGNHVVSARFTRVPVTGGNEDFRLEGLSVRTAAGETLQELPAESLLVTVAVKHLKETGSGTILLAQYDSQGRYRGLMWLTLDEMPQGMTLRVILPVDNSSGEIANLKVFVVEDLTSPLPVGTPVSFGQV